MQRLKLRQRNNLLDRKQPRPRHRPRRGPRRPPPPPHRLLLLALLQAQALRQSLRRRRWSSLARRAASPTWHKGKPEPILPAAAAAAVAADAGKQYGGWAAYAAGVSGRAWGTGGAELEAECAVCVRGVVCNVRYDFGYCLFVFAVHVHAFTIYEAFWIASVSTWQAPVHTRTRAHCLSFVMRPLVWLYREKDREVLHLVEKEAERA
jgi:hypothetical protein